MRTAQTGLHFSRVVDIPENLARFEERLEALIMLVMYA